MRAAGAGSSDRLRVRRSVRVGGQPNTDVTGAGVGRICGSGVDPIAVIDIQKIVRFLKERGIGVLITDHNVRETLGICDRAYIINAGSVMAEGKPDEIVYNESVRKVYLGENFKL